MWAEPPGAARNRVYFNVFTQQAYVWANPNVGALGTDQETVLTEYHEAILGRWIDCNQDGYVGMLETAVREYPAELLLDTGTCPPANGEGSRRGYAAAGYPANYNGWVTELVPIARPATSAGDWRVIPDADALVWGDHGVPGAAPDEVSCTLERLPYGGSRTTGRILDHVDCYLSITLGTTSADEYEEVGDGLADETGDSTLRLEEGRWAGSAHPLERETLGDENDGSYVEVFDCEGWDPTYLPTGDLPGDDLDRLYLEGLKEPEARPEGSVAGTYLYLSRAVGRDTYDYRTPCETDPWKNERDSPYALVEGTATDTSTTRKDSADWNFYFHAQARGSGLAQAREITSGGGAAPDLGLEPVATALGATGVAHSAPSRWYADSANLRKVPVLARAAITDGEVEIPPARWFSFYADVGAAVTASGFVLPGGERRYGSEACGAFESGVHGGWECDPSRWYPEYQDGRSPWEPYLVFTKVGQQYDLRDVDCVDGGNDLGVPTGLASYGAFPCR